MMKNKKVYICGIFGLSTYLNWSYSFCRNFIEKKKKTFDSQE